MGRLLFPALGLIEIGVASTLAVLGLCLPDRGDVRRGLDGARRVTTASGEQVRLLREQVADLRRTPFRRTADRLQAAGRTLTGGIRRSRINIDTIRTIRDASGKAAAGLDHLAESLGPADLGKLGEGLGATVHFLDRDLLPAAAKAADDLDAASGRLRDSTRRFAEVLRQVPSDLKPIRDLHEGLARFDAGLGALHATLDPRRVATLREAAEGAEGVVAEAARLADRAAGYSYPVVTFDGLTPRVGNRPFWPRGAEISVDMRKIAGGVAAMGRELDTLSTELPRIQDAVAESRRSVGATRQGLATVLERQGEVERLLRQMPEQAARLGEELPRMTGDLAVALRGTGGLRELVAAVRRSRKGIDVAVASWPEVRSGLSGAATLLRATRDQLDQVVEHGPEYEAAREQVEGLSGDVLELLPTLAEGLDARLDREERTLAEMAGGIAQVDEVLPAYSNALERSLMIGRLLSWLTAGVAALHGSFLILSGVPTRRERAPAAVDCES
jgi:ABC-type transporter Mla subunit MlaD